MTLKTPEMFPGSSEGRLHLIGDADTALGPDEVIGLFHEPFWELNGTGVALHKIPNQNQCD